MPVSYERGTPVSYERGTPVSYERGTPGPLTEASSERTPERCIAYMHAGIQHAHLLQGYLARENPRPPPRTTIGLQA